MNELTELLRAGLDKAGALTEVVLNAISLIFIVMGAMLSLARSIQERRRLASEHPLHTYFRKMFGGWMIVALEFQLAADIVGTIISPTTAHLIELGAIAVIRTFLNYILSKELQEEKEAGSARAEKSRPRSTESLRPS